MAESEPVVSTSLPEKEAVTVVIAMDGSEYSDYALKFYVQCLHRRGNKVLIAHNTEYKIVSSPAVAVMTGGVKTGGIDTTVVTKEIKAEEKRTEELFENLKQKVQDLKISDDCTFENIHGETGPSVVTFATDSKADYIVVGCRGKGKWRKTFTGSVTDYVTQHSHVPVIVARNIDHLEKLHLHMPAFKHHKKHDGPKSPTSPDSPQSPQSPHSHE